MNGQEHEQALIQWIGAHLGADVTHIERQPRWRPAWFIDAQRGDEALRLYVRGERLDARIGFTLDHEMRLQQLLHERGIPVPRVHGWVEAPRAYVMDRVEGLEHLNDEAPADREKILESYISTLAQIHALDVKPFAEAGILHADRPSDSGRIGMEIYEKAYRAHKKRPDAFLEFTLGWLRRHPAPTKNRESVILWDTGQFLHHQGELRALIDLEIGHVGDPMMDLAGFRMRAREIGFDDFPALYATYERVTGRPVDLPAIQHHYFAFALCNQLAFHAALADPPPGSDYMMNLRWCTETNLYAIEALAQMLEVRLEEVPTPARRETYPDAPYRHLIEWLRHFEAENAGSAHATRSAFRLARHLHRIHEIGPITELADRDDLSALLGHRPENGEAGEAALEDFVLADDGRHDEALVSLFHRRLSRGLMLLGPEGSAIARHHPVPGVRGAQPQANGRD